MTRAIAVLLGLVPFAFGTMRLATSQGDARYLWTAVASTIGAAAILARPGRSGGTSIIATVSGIAMAAVCAATCAVLLGATAGPAIAVVALAFGMCSAGAIALLRRVAFEATRPRKSP
jgi:hypothetical protein